MNDFAATRMFCALTLGLTWVAMAVGYLSGVIAPPGLVDWSTIFAFVGIMWIPAIAASLTAAMYGGSHAHWRRIWPLPSSITASKSFLASLAVSIAFALIFAIGWMLGFGSIDPSLSVLRNDLAPEQSQAFSSTPVLFGIGLVLSVTIIPAVWAAAMAGAEAGWRGWLLEQLLEQGRLRAYVLAGVLQWACLAPVSLLGYFTPEHVFLTTIELLVFCVLMSVVLGEIYRRFQHAGVTACALGMFIAQAFNGIWLALFPESNPLVTAPFGILTLLALLALGAVLFARANGRARISGAEASETPR